MFLEMITPDKKVYTGEIDLIQLPGIDGSIEVLNNHTPIISLLGKGKIKIIETKDKHTLFFDINSGVVEVLENKIVVLAD